VIHLTVLEEHDTPTGPVFRLRFNAEDFAGALLAFKQALPLDQRQWLDEPRLWEVPATEHTQRVLGSLFQDFASKLKELRSQLRLL
jgi:hypothetical protein